MSDFKKLNVWRKAHGLAINSYECARRMRPTIHSALRNQIVRTSLSIPTNIVEGCGQKSGREFARFLGIALNSANELEYHLMVARDIKAITTTDFASLGSQTGEVRKMLHGLQTRVLERTQTAAPKRPDVVT
ncbi:MAG TPA: four helix bundle protein [Gemmatimonadaceae bacterium]|nr:four helix bundle protein [Gemmatimonadaceae bacterium]